MSEELFPCPGHSVGESHNLAIYDYTPTGSAYIGLAYVKCSCGWRGRDGDSVPSAIKAWNTRPESKLYKWSQVDMVWENGGAKMKMGMKDWIVSNGFDGLYVTGTCACLVDDLGPCGSLPYSCKPGYKHMDPRPEHIGDWAIFGEKETPDEDEWEHVGY